MSIKHVNPFDPVWTVLEDPSGCAMVIVALFTTDGGAAVFALAMYSGSVFGTSSLGKADADVMRAAEATQNPTKYDRDFLLGPDKRNQLVELWEVEKYGRDSFGDPDHVHL
jgi:hypothetical protein